MSILEYEALSKEPDVVPWFSINCTIAYHESIFPFGAIENETLLNLFEYDKPSVVDSVPSFDITSHLTNYDIARL